MSQATNSRGLASYFDDNDDDEAVGGGGRSRGPKAVGAGLEGDGDSDLDIDLDGDEFGELGGPFGRKHRAANKAERAKTRETQEQFAARKGREGNAKAAAKKAAPGYVAPVPGARRAAASAKVKAEPVTGTRRYNAKMAAQYRNEMAVAYARTDALVKANDWTGTPMLNKLTALKKTGKERHDDVVAESKEPYEERNEATGRMEEVVRKGFDKRNYVHMSAINMNIKEMTTIFTEIREYAMKKGMKKVLTEPTPLRQDGTRSDAFISVYMDWIFAQKRQLMAAVAVSAGGTSNLTNTQYREFRTQSQAGDAARRKFEEFKAKLRTKVVPVGGAVKKPRREFGDEEQRNEQRTQFMKDRGESARMYAGLDELEIFGE